MKSPFQQHQFKLMLQYFILAIAVIISYKFIMGIDTFIGGINWFFNVISPFISGFLLAYILNIPCNGIRRLLDKSQNKFLRTKSKILSILASYFLLFFVIYLVIRLIVPSITSSVSFFVSNFNSYYVSIQEYIIYINELVLPTLNISTDKILEAIRDFSLQKLPSSINAIFSFSSGVFKVVLAFIASVYVLVEKDSFKKYLNRVLKVFLSESVYMRVLKYSTKLNVGFKQYIYTQTIDGVILGTLATIELVLLKSPYALILGIMLGVVNYIPYFGSIFGTMFTVLLVAFTQDITTGILATIILLITQQVDANVIQPRLMSGSFSLSPLLVIIGITIGGAIYGVLGMIVAIPILSVIKGMFEEIVTYYEASKLTKQ